MAQTQRRQTQNVGDVITGNLALGAVGGGIAYVLGFIVTYIFAVIDGVSTSGQVAMWKAVGWVFYAAHNVKIATTISANGQSQSQSFDIFAQASNAGTSGLTSTIPGIVYKLIPVVVLIAVGYVVYRQVGSQLRDTGSVAALGATITVGYLVLTVVGRFLFSVSQSGSGMSATVAPELVTSIVLVGLVYPIVLGVVGAVLGEQTS